VWGRDRGIENPLFWMERNNNILDLLERSAERSDSEREREGDQ
jgi:hypothetical protein